MSLSAHAKSTYRSILRELPRRSLTSPTPLHNRIREAYRKPNTTKEETVPDEKADGDAAEVVLAVQRRINEAEQFARYARAQRVYAMLVERYNPGSSMDEEERIRLTARRVGLDLPAEVGGEV